MFNLIHVCKHSQVWNSTKFHFLYQAGWGQTRVTQNKAVKVPFGQEKRIQTNTQHSSLSAHLVQNTALPLQRIYLDRNWVVNRQKILGCTFPRTLRWTWLVKSKVKHARRLRGRKASQWVLNPSAKKKNISLREEGIVFVLHQTIFQCWCFYVTAP